MKQLLVKFKKAIFILLLRRIRRKNFYIISQNCTGSLFYKLINKEYLTPTVDLFFYAPCFVKIASNIQYYINLELKEVKQSKYVEGNLNLVKNGFYPIGVLDDVEIHFLHYNNWDEVIEKWTRRKNRINLDKVFL